MRRPLLPLLLSLLPALLAGCDMLGIETPAVVTAKREAEGKAIGGACRHAGRAIEDCYTLNKKAEKAAIYAGWREMDDYMRENKLEPVAPQLTADAKGKGGNAEGDNADEGDRAKADTKTASKSEAKSDSKADGKADAKEHASAKKGSSNAH